MYNLGIAGDVNNSIFMTNAYPWADAFGVVTWTDDFSRRTNGQPTGGAGAAVVGPQNPPAPQPKSHWLIYGAIIVAVIIFIASR